jgi:hypothetical protein
VKRWGGLSVLVMALTACPPNRITAQVSVRASLGARFSTALVKDSIVVPIQLKPGIAPALLLSVRDEFQGPYTGDLTIDLSPTTLNREESGTSADAGSVTTVAFTLGLRRDLHPGVAARLALGGLVYVTENTGVFQQGNGGVFPLVALGGSYAPSFGAKHRLEVALNYDVHRFMTPALRTTGFPNPRPVHRLALTVSARLLGQ